MDSKKRKQYSPEAGSTFNDQDFLAGNFGIIEITSWDRFHRKNTESQSTIDALA